jgi:hypothetical protein
MRLREPSLTHSTARNIWRIIPSITLLRSGASRAPV